MALGEAILILLAGQPMSGYALAKTFDTDDGFFWCADHQQVYRELVRLRELGFVEGEAVVQQGRPNKNVHRLTEAGRQHLRAWSHRPTEARATKDDLLVRLFAVEAFDLGLLRAELARRLDAHHRRRERFRQLFARNFTTRPLDLGQRGRLLGLRLALRQEESWVAWCEEALEFLPQQDEPRAALEPLTGARWPADAEGATETGADSRAWSGRSLGRTPLTPPPARPRAGRPRAVPRGR